MALSEWQTAEIKTTAEPFLEQWRSRRLSEYIKSVDIQIEDQSVILYEIHKPFDGKGEDIFFPIAKATFQKSAEKWKLFWQMRDLKWHGYEPSLFHSDIESVFCSIDKDVLYAFWG